MIKHIVFLTLFKFVFTVVDYLAQSHIFKNVVTHIIRYTVV